MRILAITEEQAASLLACIQSHSEDLGVVDHLESPELACLVGIENELSIQAQEELTMSVQQHHVAASHYCRIQTPRTDLNVRLDAGMTPAEALKKFAAGHEQQAARLLNMARLATAAAARV